MDGRVLQTRLGDSGGRAIRQQTQLAGNCVFRSAICGVGAVLGFGSSCRFRDFRAARSMFMSLSSIFTERSLDLPVKESDYRRLWPGGIGS